MKFYIKKFEELSNFEIYEIGKLRQEVFIVEQNCPYLDFDNKDLLSYHIFAKDEINNKIICYSRIIPKNLSYSSPTIGRVLVDKNYRHNGYARKLLLCSIDAVKFYFPNENITIGAQYYLLDFYRSLGFKAISEKYDEDEIPHIDMILNLTNL